MRSVDVLHRSVACVLSALLVALIPPHVAAQSDAFPGLRHPLVPSVRAIFQQENRRIERVAVLEVKSASATGPHLLVGWGIRPDRRFEGDFKDELFGMFLLNADQTSIERTLDIIPTPRWMDYEFHIEEITSAGATVTGKGSTYGDGARSRRYTFD